MADANGDAIGRNGWRSSKGPRIGTARHGINGSGSFRQIAAATPSPLLIHLQTRNHFALAPRAIFASQSAFDWGRFLSHVTAGGIVPVDSPSPGLARA